MQRSIILTSLLGLAALTTGCAGASVHYKPFGRLDPTEKRRVEDQYAVAQEAPLSDAEQKIEVLDSTFPAGITVEGQTIKVAEDSSYAVLGEFDLDFSTQWLLPEDTEVSQRLKKVAAVAGGDVVVTKLEYKNPSYPYVMRATGIVLRSKPADTAPVAPEAVAPEAGAETATEAPSGDVNL
jgi:hypothetical protein